MKVPAPGTRQPPRPAATQRAPDPAGSRVVRLRRSVYRHLHDLDSTSGRVVNFVILASILLLCVIFVWRTYASVPLLIQVLDGVEAGIVVLFIVEYLLRLWVAPRRLRHTFKLSSLIDLLAILPFFFAGTDLQIVRIFRMLRIMRVVRFLETPSFFFGRLRPSQLALVRVIFVLVAIVFVAAGLVFQAEREVNPEHFGTFFDGVYFAIVTMTTVGFGDITPKSDYGRLVTILIIVSAVVFVPWQVKNLIESWIISAGKQEITCPHCGRQGHDGDAVFCKQCGGRLGPHASMADFKL